jgi:transcriptional repressor NrdR
MQCSYCGSGDTKVLETRQAESGGVHRRRQCKQCGQRFATVERINVEYLSVRKRDNRIERFQPEKIVRSIGEAASVFKIPATDINAFIDRILDQLQPESPGLPIPSNDIGNVVLRFLQDATSVTDVARIRFAMVFLGKISRPDGFKSAHDLRRWLADNYPALEDEETDAQTSPALVLKRRNQGVEPFDIRKLERSISAAAKGRGSDSRVRALASEIAGGVLADLTSQPIVTSQQISAFALRRLRETDDIAYLRYAAATKPFRSVDDFWLETLALIRRPDVG